MDDGGEGADINQPMQPLPAARAESLDPAGRRCRRKRNQEHQTREANRNERPFADVAYNFRRVKKFVEPKISQKMEASVEEGEQSEHPAKQREPRHAQYLAGRRDR